jgi:hypothetical protein
VRDSSTTTRAGRLSGSRLTVVAAAAAAARIYGAHRLVCWGGGLSIRKAASVRNPNVH